MKFLLLLLSFVSSLVLLKMSDSGKHNLLRIKLKV